MKIDKVDGHWRINDSHNMFIGYLLWILGFTGAHRFYFGRPWTGLLYMCTLGLLGIGWLVDFFLIPGMDRSADRKYLDGPLDYSVAWLLLTFLGIFGVHRFYIGKPLTGILYLCTGGFFIIGVAYDFWTLNEQVADQQARALRELRERSAQ